jgi:DNA repair exonuclease SbcCD ATPase subunit
MNFILLFLSIFLLLPGCKSGRKRSYYLSSVQKRNNPKNKKLEIWKTNKKIELKGKISALETKLQGDAELFKMLENKNQTILEKINSTEKINSKKYKSVETEMAKLEKVEIIIGKEDTKPKVRDLGQEVEDLRHKLEQRKKIDGEKIKELQEELKKANTQLEEMIQKQLDASVLLKEKKQKIINAELQKKEERLKQAFINSQIEAAKVKSLQQKLDHIEAAFKQFQKNPE